MQIGKQIRMKRILREKNGRTIIVPMDHGMTLGPIKGLENMNGTLESVDKGADAVIVHKGIAISADMVGRMNAGLIVHLSAGTSLNPKNLSKVFICDVEEAVAIGADGVSVHINIGSENESTMLENLGKVAKDCLKWGIPLIAMMYPRGMNIEENPETIKLAARVGAEAGADIIKCPYTGDTESFREVVEGCGIPVVIAGGEKDYDERTFLMIHGAIKAGAKGISMGRNVFQHDNPGVFLKAARLIVHENASADEAYSFLKSEIDKESLKEKKEILSAV